MGQNPGLAEPSSPPHSSACLAEGPPGGRGRSHSLNQRVGILDWVCRGVVKALPDHVGSAMGGSPASHSQVRRGVVLGAPGAAGAAGRSPPPPPPPLPHPTPFAVAGAGPALLQRLFRCPPPGDRQDAGPGRVPGPLAQRGHPQPVAQTESGERQRVACGASSPSQSRRLAWAARGQLAELARQLEQG